MRVSLANPYLFPKCTSLELGVKVNGSVDDPLADLGLNVTDFEGRSFLHQYDGSKPLYHFFELLVRTSLG